MRERSFVGGDDPHWLVVFQRRCESRWIGWLAMGRHKHVLALRWVRTSDVGHWLVYDVSRRQTIVCLLNGDDQIVDKLVEDSCVVKMPVRDDSSKVLRFGFWCVPAVAHLLGLRSCAVRPDALLRHCLGNGGSIIQN